MARKPQRAQDYYSRDFDNDAGVRIEMEPVDSFTQHEGPSTSRFEDERDIYNDFNNYVPNQRYHTMPKTLAEQLPSRSIDVTRKPSSHGSNSGYGTLRLRAVSIYKGLPEDQVIQMLEDDPKIDALDDIEAEKHKEAALRELHYSLTGKRKIKARLDKRASIKHKKLGCFKQMKYTLSMKWYKFKKELKESISRLELWQKPLHIIEGKFGSSVASYFYLLRWLLYLNVLTFLIQFLFVVVPQMLLNFVPNAQQEPLPCSNNFTLNYSNAFSVPEFSPEILLTGGGWFEHTFLYYGGYSNTILSLISDLSYNIPIAYLVIIGFNIVLVLIFMAYALAKSYKERFIEHSGLKMNFFSNKVFCGWDFAITNPKAAQLHSRCLCLDLTEYLSQLQKRTVVRTIGEKTIRFFRFLFFNALSVALLCLTGWLIYFLLEQNFLKTDIRVLSEMNLSMMVVLITLVVPTILTFIVKFEGYNSRRTQLWVTMIRCLLLIGVIICILLSFWIPKNLDDDGFINIFTRDELSKHSCWETQVGKEIYRLVLMDFLVCGVLYFFTFWFKSVMYKNGFKYLGIEFDIAWNFWNLLYNQVLGWIGSLFSPLLSLIIIVKMILTFYIKQSSVRLHAQPAEQSLRAQNLQTIFLIMSFLALVSSLLGIGFIIIQVKPSVLCGPFRGREYPYGIIFCVTESFQEYELWLGKTVTFVTKPGCVVIVVIFLCCVTYYSRALAAANLKMMTLLRQQVVLEGKDKVFLLRMFDRSFRDLQGKPSGLDNSNVISASNTNAVLVEASNSGIVNEPRRFSSERFDFRSDSPKPTEFPRKKSTPTEHRVLAEISPGSKRRRKMSSQTEAEHDRSSAELYPYRSHESLNSYPFINPAFREDSPFKSKTPPVRSPLHDPLRPLPGVSHQPPFQNLGKFRRSSKHQSEEDLKSIQSKYSR